VHREDFLRLELSLLPSPAKVVSNLPYSAGTPILQRLLDWPGCSSAVLMFQKEVAERILAGPGGKRYGLLSLSVRLKADAEPVLSVPRSCFRPMPGVDSAVVRLRRLDRPRLPEGLSEEAFFRAAKAAFMHRRKTAANSVAAALGLGRPAVEAAFDACGLSPGVRAEVIDLDGFVRLARSLSA
jgi:16S rRNA (adenine1518-N6/adenine1519-N6)-dimethyltransferase